MAEGLVEAAEQVMAALRRNVETFSLPEDAAAMVSANDALAEAAQRYADVVFELTGWGNPFVLPKEDDGEELGASPDERSAETVGVVVNARYEIAVHSFDELRRYVVNRGLQVEQPPDREEGEEVEYIQALFEADGWKPQGYPEVATEAVDHEWQIQSSLIGRGR